MNAARTALLARHEKAWHSLASARRQALLESLPPSRPLWWRVLFVEFFAPQRAVWLALAACWVLILSIQFWRAAESPSAPLTPLLADSPFLTMRDATLLEQLDVGLRPQALPR